MEAFLFYKVFCILVTWIVALPSVKFTKFSVSTTPITFMLNYMKEQKTITTVPTNLNVKLKNYWYLWKM